MAETPVSYKDPTYASLDAAVTQKLGLPDGLLDSIRTKGERSNADQVSEAGARSVYQIIPATRDAVLKKYGVDAYLNPQNAAEAAGLLLKESLDRNKGDATLAVAEYHGGTDRANWGPRTKAYVGRVVGDLAGAAAPVPPAQPVADYGAPAVGAPSTFDRVMAQMTKPDESKMSAVLQAYQGGRMSPEDERAFEAQVNDGHVMLPKGVALKTEPAPQATELPGAVVQAYNSGRMTSADRAQVDQLVKSGIAALPQGATLTAPKEMNFLERTQEAITGTQRRTAETNALPDWATMPELNSLSLASAKTGLGTLLSNPAETAQIIKANFPAAQVRQDEKGNFLIRSAADGQEYAIKPGFQVSDIPRAVGALAAFTPAGRAATIPGAMVGAGLTQAAIEGTQAATGGTFDPKEVAIATAVGGAVPVAARAVGAGFDAGKAALARARGLPEPAVNPAQAVREAAAGAPEASAAGEEFQHVAMPPRPTIVVNPAGEAQVAPSRVAPVAPAAPVVSAAPAVAPLAAADLAQTAKTAAEGGMGASRATRILADQAAPDAQTVAAAKRLGIEDHLQPDHVTTNQAYRELAQAVKSIPGSEARAAEMQGLEKVGQRADDLISEIGGTTDASTLSSTVKARMQATQTALEAQANDLYDKVRQAIPPKAEAPATNTVAFIRQRADELGGATNLSAMEKKLLTRLSPLETASTAQKQPTYALLDDMRRDVGAAARMAGPFKDADTGLAKKLYSLITEDQAAVVGSHGASELFNAAKASVAVRKGLEDDLVSLFGKQLDRSLVADLSGAVRALPQGDASKLVRLVASVPDDLKQQVVASGVTSAFRTAATRGPINFTTYAKWYEGLLRNKQAYAAVMSNLPPAARKQLSDLYRVSKGISAASRERITTGRIQAVMDEFKGPDNLAGRLYETAKRSAVSATAGTAAGAVMGPGVGAAVASALSRGAKPNAIKAADALIASPEFAQLARQGGNEAAKVRRFAYSQPFTRYVRAVGSPRELSNREKWVLQVLQGRNNSQD